MIYSKYRFSLEIQSAHSQIAIPVMVGDTGSAFYIALTEGGNPFVIPDGTLAMLTIRRPTGTHLQAFCSIKHNTTIIYDFMQNENTAIVEGVHNCELTLYGAQTGSVISTSWFTMTVSERVVNSDSINITDENRTAIDAMIAAEASRQTNEESRINSEASRAAAEEARENAEAERESACAEAVKEAEDMTDTLQTLRDSGAFNGVSPTIETSKTGNVTTLTITDATGIKTATILDGADGADGRNGADGKDGADGAQGEQGPQGEKGETGATGADGISPTVSVSKVGKVTTITITDVNGTKTATIKDGEDGTGSGDGTGGADGENGVGIASVVQTTTSAEDGGINIITVTLTDGSAHTFQVRNGSTGEKGADGYTPVKGTDYYTDADKTEMVNLVLAALPTWTGGSY